MTNLTRLVGTLLVVIGVAGWLLSSFTAARRARSATAS